MLGVFWSRRNRVQGSRISPVWRPRRRHHRFGRFPGWLASVLAATIITLMAGATAWVVAGGDLDRLPVLISFGVQPASAASPPDGVPVLIESTPTGAEVRVDGASGGVTPAQLSLSPGLHSLLVRQASSMELVQLLEVPSAGRSVSIELWRGRPLVLPLRAVYPGAGLIDARFFDEGKLGLRVNSGAGPGMSQPNASDELWELDPTTGGLERHQMGSASESQVSAAALSTDGQQVAYATGGKAISASLWPASSSASVAGTADAAAPSVRVVSKGQSNPVTTLELDLTPASTTTDAQHITDLVWTPDGQRLVVLTRTNSTPARGRLILVDLGSGGDNAAPTVTELAVMPAEILPRSAVVDPTGQWLAFAARATTASNTANLTTLCIVELRSGGTLRDVAELGPAQRLPALIPLAWAPAPSAAGTSQLAFVAPVAAPTTASGTGLFDIFGALRQPATPSGLFVLDVNGGSAISQPRRLGTVTGLAAPVWRDDSIIYGFSRRDDGSLSLGSVDVSTGALHDTGGLIPPGTIQGTGLAARWDVTHGRALLVTRPASGSTGQPAAGLQAWLVSFLSSSEVQP